MIITKTHGMLRKPQSSVYRLFFHHPLPKGWQLTEYPIAWKAENNHQSSLQPEPARKKSKQRVLCLRPTADWGLGEPDALKTDSVCYLPVQQRFPGYEKGRMRLQKPPKFPRLSAPF